MANEIAQFSADDGRKIAQAVRDYNRRFGSSPPDSRGAVVNGYGLVRAKVTTAIPSGTFDAPSSTGRVQIYHKDATGAWIASGDPVQIFNDNVLTASIPVGRTVKPGWIGGEWWLISGSCS